MEHPPPDSSPQERVAALHDRALAVLPGGVNSPVRAFRSVGLPPLFAERAEGPFLWDTEGRQYIDYIGSWGPLILGHAHPIVLEAIHRAASRGTSFGMATREEVLFAEEIRRVMPGMEKLRLVSSGTEATMSALRLARAATGRERIVKFEGHYHGHADSLLVAAGSGVATLGTPDSPGVPKGLASLTSVVPWNDLPALSSLFFERGGEIGAVILEPVAGNMGCVPPHEGFLEAVATLCRAHGALLIFDEVMTGFRVALGGAQARYGIRPDLTCLGKIVGGGLPCAAYGGRADLMDLVSPSGPVYQAGTLSGNPLAVAAGRAQLRLLQEEGVYEALEERGSRLEAGIRASFPPGLPLVLQRVGTMWTLFFREEPVRSFSDAKASDVTAFRRFYAHLLGGGVLLPPSPFEAAFLSLAHGEEELERTAGAVGAALREAARG